MATVTSGLTDAQIAAIGGLAQTLQADPNFAAALQSAASQKTRSAPSTGGTFTVPQMIAALDQIKAMLQSSAGQPDTGTGQTGQPGTGWPSPGPVTRSPAHAAAAAAAVGLA